MKNNNWCDGILVVVAKGSNQWDWERNGNETWLTWEQNGNGSEQLGIEGCGSVIEKDKWSCSSVYSMTGCIVMRHSVTVGGS